jgi:hypothetical protein
VQGDPVFPCKLLKGKERKKPKNCERVFGGVAVLATTIQKNERSQFLGEESIDRPPFEGVRVETVSPAWNVRSGLEKFGACRGIVHCAARSWAMKEMVGTFQQGSANPGGLTLPVSELVVVRQCDGNLEWEVIL